MSDALGDRMKSYEMTEAGRRCMPLLPVVARLDGKCFSKFTKGLRRPYDERLSDLMVDTVRFMVQETSAVCGYTQSDEITLAWLDTVYFDGRIQKMTSVLAAKCSVVFNHLLPQYLPEKDNYGDGACKGPVPLANLPVFDCRVWQLPTLEEATNAFLWREFDATKNSISMAASEYYSDKELFGKHGGDKQEMLWQKGINWNDYPAFFKRGSYIQRRVVRSKLTDLDLENLPPLHNARKNPDMEFERTDYRRLEMPPFSQVTNRVGVIFHGEEPQSASNEVRSADGNPLVDPQ